jgi:hypothetical protein
MNARDIQDQKAIAREIFVQQAAHDNASVSASPLRGATRCSTESRRDYTLDSKADEFCEATDTSLLAVARVDTANLMRVLRQLELAAKRQAPRIAFKAKGSILLLDLADILAVQAEGNYVSLQRRPNPLSSSWWLSPHFHRKFGGGIAQERRQAPRSSMASPVLSVFPAMRGNAVAIIPCPHENPS